MKFKAVKALVAISIIAIAITGVVNGRNTAKLNDGCEIIDVEEIEEEA